MGLKIFKGMWFLSALAVLANLLYVFASLPENVVVQEEGAKLVTVSRDGFFYGNLVVIALVNVLVYVIAKIYNKQPDFRLWFYGFVITLNVFFIIAMSFIATYNSGEKFDFSKIAFVVYGSVALVVLWALAWPVYSVFRKFFVKPEH